MASDHDERSLEQRIYAIENAYREQIEPHRKALGRLKDEQERVLSEAQKSFEANEKDHAERRREADRRLQKERSAEAKAYDLRIEEQIRRIQKDKADMESGLETLENEHKHARTVLEAELEDIQRQKDAKSKEIRSSYQEDAAAYRERIDLYEKNLEKNKRQGRERLEKALKDLDKLHASERRKLKHVETRIDKDFKPHEKAIEKAIETQRKRLKKLDGSFQHRLNMVRKEVNQTIRAVSSNLTRTRERLLEPFQDFEKTLDDVSDFFDTYQKDFKNQVHQDVSAEKVRLRNLKDDESAGRDHVNKQNELNQARQEALYKHVDALQETLGKTLRMFRSLAGETKQTVESAIEEHESLVFTHQERLKQIFDHFQDASPKLLDELDTYLGDHPLHQELKQLKTHFKSIFKALHAFESRRIKEIIDVTRELLPIYDEIDDIRFRLDIKDAEKEIRYTDARAAIDEEDAILRLRMKETQKQHEQTLADIEHHFRIEEKKLQQAMHQAKEEQVEHDLQAKKDAALDRLQAEYEHRRAAIDHELRRRHAETDRDQLERRRELEQTRLSTQQTIETLEAKRNRDIQLEEVKAAHENSILTTRLEIRKTMKRRDRTAAEIQQIEKRIDAAKEEELKQAFLDIEHQKTELSNQIETLKRRHQERLRFIDEALDRETKSARERLEGYRSMVESRLKPQRSKNRELKQTLEHFQRAADSDDASLADLLAHLKRPYVDALKDHVSEVYATIREARSSALEERVSETARQEGDDKAASLEARLQQQFTKAEESDAKARAKKLETLENLLEDARKAFRNHETMTLDTVAAIAGEAAEGFQEILQDIEAAAEEQLDALFKPLKDAEQATIDRAESSAIKAKEEAEREYEQNRQPLEDKLASFDAQWRKTKQQIEEQYAERKRSELASLKEEEDRLQSEVERLESTLDARKQSLEDEKASIEDEHHRTLENIQARKQEEKKQLEARFDRQIGKIDTRLGDSKNILQYAEETAEAAKKDIDTHLQRRLEENQETYDRFHNQAKTRIEALAEEKSRRNDEENQRLKERTDAFERQILDTSSRLDARLEKISRELEDRARLDRGRKEHLESTVADKEKALQDRLEGAFATLEETLSQAREDTLLDARDESLPDTVFTLEDELLEEFIEETIASIKSTDK